MVRGNQLETNHLKGSQTFFSRHSGMSENGNKAIPLLVGISRETQRPPTISGDDVEKPELGARRFLRADSLGLTSFSA